MVETTRHETADQFDPYYLTFLAESNSIKGDIFAYFAYFSELIETFGRKPWGRKGKENLMEAILTLDKQYDYEHWITCQTCHIDFVPAINRSLLTYYLKYLKEEIDYDDLYTCKDCGGIEYLEKAKVEEPNLSEAEILTLLTDAYRNGLASLKRYIDKYETRARWGTVVIVTSGGETAFIKKVKEISNQQMQGKYDEPTLPFTLSVAIDNQGRIAVAIRPQDKEIADLLWHAYELQLAYIEGILEVLTQHRITHFFAEGYLD